MFGVVLRVVLQQGNTLGSLHGPGILERGGDGRGRGGVGSLGRGGEVRGVTQPTLLKTSHPPPPPTVPDFSSSPQVPRFYLVAETVKPLT